MTAKREVTALDPDLDATVDEKGRLLLREKGRRQDIPISREALWGGLLLLEDRDRPTLSFMHQVVQTFVYRDALPRNFEDPSAIYEHVEIQMDTTKEAIVEFLADPTVSRRREAMVAVEALVGALAVLGGEIDSTEITE